MHNPLLQTTGLTTFSKIELSHIQPALDRVLQENRDLVKTLDNIESPNWSNFIHPLEEMDDRLNRIWAIVNHLNSVTNSQELRTIYNACLPKISEYATEMGQHNGIHNAFQSIASDPGFTALDPAKQMVVKNRLRDFRLSGINLDPEKKQRFKQIQRELSELSARFEDNVLDATFGWNKHITDESLLTGLPESALAMAKQTAEAQKVEGWCFTLEFPSYFAVMSYADNRELRQEMYTAYVTRASDQGPNANTWDNSPVIDKILQLRHELANVLGFEHFAQLSLETKMALNPDKVISFLQDLTKRSTAMAKQELQELTAFAHEKFNHTQIEVWDLTYYAEKLRLHRFNLTQEDLKPYFPEDRVLHGLFEIVHRLYGLNITEHKDIDTWHPDVRFFEITDAHNTLRGQFYLDLYSRKNKRGGAWMAECVSRKRNNDELQLPIAFLTCNLSPPINNQPAQFTHDEVVTLFHEFGHGLHHMLTKIDYPSVSGISGVPWDGVELPSQIMENWCWEKEALRLFAIHFQTNEPLPETMIDNMLAMKNFHSGLAMLRQLEFALFDFKLHMEYKLNEPNFVQTTLNKIREQVAVIQPPDYNRFQHGFSHIFAGGYAAGYYSYKWAEVLSSDAFAKFEESGIFNRQTGLEFLNTVLEQGGATDLMDLFVEFRGREPQIEALLRHSGITT